MSETSHPGEIEEALRRQRAFWLQPLQSSEGAPVDRPLLKVAPWQGWQPYPPFVLSDGSTPEESYEITPGLLDPLGSLQATRPARPVDGDFISGWGAYDQCWSEALLGCRVRRVGPSVWTEPFLEDWESVEAIPAEGNAAWLDELLRVNQVLVEAVDGAYPVSQPLMRGPLDMAAAAMPSERLYAGFYEAPEQVRSLLERCADIFVHAAHRRLECTPRFHGGYAARYEWGLWAPGTTVQFQADASRNLSQKTYREFLFEIDRRIAGAFEYSIMHTHSGSHHILPVLVEVPELRAIEVSLDPEPYGPPPLELLADFEMVQRAGKSLLISGPMKRVELGVLLERLSPMGLGIRAGIVEEN
jgi:hypothetical protein